MHIVDLGGRAGSSYSGNEPYNNGVDADQRIGAGYDQIDVEACTSRGIIVSNTPDVVNDATADANMFLILGALRGFNHPMQTLRDGQWRGNPLPPLGRDPRGKILGIVGMGRIGRNLKKKARMFGMRVIYHNRTEDVTEDAEYVGFQELLSISDVISLNLPLNVSIRSPYTLAAKDLRRRQYDTLLASLWSWQRAWTTLEELSCQPGCQMQEAGACHKVCSGYPVEGYADTMLATGKHTSQDFDTRIRPDEKGRRNRQHCPGCDYRRGSLGAGIGQWSSGKRGFGRL